MIGETRRGGKGGGRGELSCGLDACGKHRSLTDGAFPLGRTVGLVSILNTRVSLLNREKEKIIE